MYGFDTRPQDIETTASSAFLDPAVLTRGEIDDLIKRGDRLRAEAIRQFGRSVAATLSSVFRRPGRMTVPPSEAALKHS